MAGSADGLALVALLATMVWQRQHFCTCVLYGTETLYYILYIRLLAVRTRTQTQSERKENK